MEPNTSGFTLFKLVDFALSIYAYLIIARVILSWVQIQRTNQIIEIVYKLTDPFLAQIRRFVPLFGNFDVSPIVAVLIIQIIRRYIS